MKRLLASLLGTAIALGSATAMAAEADLQALEQAARKEGQVNSVGMPDSWANWKDTWKDLESKYGLKHMDTDMSSAQELAKFKAEGENASADIGDVGAAFGPIAVQQDVSQPYKPSTWDQVPDWARDKDGHWALAYTGTIAFIVNKQLVKDVPRSWADLLKGKYKVTIGDVSSAARDTVQENSTLKLSRRMPCAAMLSTLGVGTPRTAPYAPISPHPRLSGKIRTMLGRVACASRCRTSATRTPSARARETKTRARMRRSGIGDSQKVESLVAGGQ